MPSLDSVRTRWSELTSFDSTGVAVGVAVLTGALTFVVALGALSVLERVVSYSSLLGVATTIVSFVCSYAAVCYAATRVMENRRG
ncbi:hypothetical protein [Salarchaeum sp. JOR-1]|uniref:hypothetical protein n=1 Tax=Salarchaeum sp. JOR-1 TaxID=2599399 RepID=UPI001198C7F7|nr:hypothetical protein [Salarchaeum sp. JOR-1]QDX41527.1 hypothetical protein FQU85_11675 [Salarchaeum sp. JOR-1]